MTEFARDDLHREILRTQGALTQRRGYDARGRRIWQNALPQALSGSDRVRPQQGKVWRTFHFDPAGELVRTEDAHRGVQHYRYDAESRLLGYGQPEPLTGQETFHYDDADNLLGLPETVREHLHGGQPAAFRSNRLPYWKHTGFVYDGFGNLMQRTQGSLTQYFVYDDENRLLRSWGEGPQGRYEACYHYDALGRRIRKTVRYQAEEREVTTCFRWQGLRLIQETAEGTTRSYVYDPDEEWTPLARITQRGEQRQTEWFHTDLNGAPLELTDRAGNIVWCGRYSAWGRLHPQPYTKEEEGELPRQPLRYAGQFADEETGLHYNTFRYYDPEVGRFTTQDPIGLEGGLNLYQYGPNPVTWIDPLGLAAGCGPNKKTSYEGKSRRDAFRQAKRDAGIPMKQQPKSITRPELLDGNGKVIIGGNGQPIKTRQYEFVNNNGESVFIQEHSLGHAKATPRHGVEPHFNVRPADNLKNGNISGTHGYYNF